MKQIFWLLVFLLFLPSCSIYRQNFDCPPEGGVSCTSVSDLEQMIVETKQGPDLFFGKDPTPSPLDPVATSNRIWVSNGRGGGCFIYFHQEEECCELSTK